MYIEKSTYSRERHSRRLHDRRCENNRLAAGPETACEFRGLNNNKTAAQSERNVIIMT